MLQVVWFKKDLRWTDHAPLVHAARSGPVLAVWMHEPEAWRQPDASPRHLAFAHDCLADLERWLVSRGGGLWRPQADARVVLQRIRRMRMGHSSSGAMRKRATPGVTPAIVRWQPGAANAAWPGTSCRATGWCAACAIAIAGHRRGPSAWSPRRWRRRIDWCLPRRWTGLASPSACRRVWPLVRTACSMGMRLSAAAGSKPGPC